MHDRTPFQFALPNWSYGRLEFQVLSAFLIWDGLAIAHHDWSFDIHQILGIYGPFNIPLEEYGFFLVVPLAAIMTLEAVRRVKKDWLIGDES